MTSGLEAPLGLSSRADPVASNGDPTNGRPATCKEPFWLGAEVVTTCFEDVDLLEISTGALHITLASCWNEHK